MITGLSIFILVIGVMCAGMVIGICLAQDEHDLHMEDAEIDEEIAYLQEIKRRNQEARRRRSEGRNLS